MGFFVLFIDSYDSFTYNVVQLIKDQRSDIEVITIHNDSFSDFKDLKPYLNLFDAILLGPGPGNPCNGSEDVGIIGDLFKNKVDVPILGICLGLQVMCYEHGCKVEQLKQIRHGQVYEIEVVGNSELFKSYANGFSSVRYHSLHVSALTNEIVPLAYTKDEDTSILMAATVKGRPWYGVQYHPESCCSEFGGLLIQNFINIAAKYNDESLRKEQILMPLRNDRSKFEEMIQVLDKTIDKSPIYQKKPLYNSKIQVEKYKIGEQPMLTNKICDNISDPFFLLASSSLKPRCGQVSVIALPNQRTTVFTRYNQLGKTTVHKWRDPKISVSKYAAALKGFETNENIKVISEDKNHFWKTIGEFLKERMISNEAELPFIGGLVGILGYEMGQYLQTYFETNLRPDAKLAFIENSILIDHLAGTLYLISLSNDFPSSIKTSVQNTLQEVRASSDIILSWSSELPEAIEFNIKMPAKEQYAEAFRKTQKYLHRGDSYEVCITTQTKVTPSHRIQPWKIFQTLVQKNPAPFSSFLEFSDIIPTYSDLTLISGSPERFLKWSQDNCELRPIKGTVKKDPGVSVEEATKILKTPKEFGENLMILDLIRNDMYELLPKVSAKEIMLVEEYETVFQLVSVVKAEGIKDSIYTGLDILKHSLPPGSMTGAPKKITVGLLQKDIEDKLNEHLPQVRGLRGAYSGVTGYLSVNGNADWSVNIRCMYSYDNATNWYIGAGGAITVLSTLEGEWEEMHTKLNTALQLFSNK
ncbi:4-amino-4-deoxychorismate synthase Ecym_2502 [Eremothecium cymbalariae DBVPG|uniref:aminodeoxychorismate synthase n=1 Tax=Eremothecium cymbalariae (strain CBS 270.75 / DBVPG 7215 / KCTC 17166 / NRRL Y-17582) TaxID=931890 RepID=G8JPW6_ERECY|nr:Hypothetical protein Ecym_2502 [Eremothecium cymbalariae DBVPG\